MKPPQKATLYLFLTTWIWGSTFVAGKIGLDAMAKLASSEFLGVLWLNSARMILAVALFAILVPKSVRRFRRAECANSFWIAFPAAIGIAINGWGLSKGEPTVTAFLTNLTVVFTPIVGYLLFRQRASASLVLGVVLAFAGVFVMTNPTGGHLGWPEVAVLGSAILFTIQIHLIERLTPGRDPEAMTLGLMLHLGWLSLLPIAIAGRSMLTPEFLRRAWVPEIVWSTVYLSLFASVVAMWVFMRYQKEIPATRAAVIYCFEPVFTAVFAWMILHEPMGWRKLAGGALILVGNLACELVKPTPPPSVSGEPPG